MNRDRISLESLLSSIFETTEWTQYQHNSYVTLKHYVNNFKENNKKYEIKDDRLIIRNNLKDQRWFTFSKSKPLMSNLLDSMILERYICDDNEYCVNFMLVISFGSFKLHACLYKNKVNNLINYYVSFENNAKQRAYMAYYTISMGTEPTENMKKIKLPEFEKIYTITSISSQMFYQYDLLNFFAEIIMYYDESGLIGDISLGNNTPITFNQLITKYNNYINQKNADTGYIVI